MRGDQSPGIQQKFEGIKNYLSQNGIGCTFNMAQNDNLNFCLSGLRLAVSRFADEEDLLVKTIDNNFMLETVISLKLSDDNHIKKFTSEIARRKTFMLV